MPLRETLEAIRNGPTPGNEESAKMWILSPILQDLGWRPYDVQWEYQVGRGKGRVDAALTGPKGAAAFIEAKAPGSRLDDHVEQVLGYAFQEGVNICALTTGLEWWLYLPAERGYQFDDRRFAKLHLKENPVEQLATDFAAFLGKEKLLSGEAEKKAKQVLKAHHDEVRLDKEVRRIWREMLNAPDEELIELVSKRVYEKTNLRPIPYQVTTVLKDSPSPKSSTEPSGSPTKRPVHIKLFGDYYKVNLWNEVIKRVADVLYERRRSDFDRVLNLGMFASRNPNKFRYAYEVDDSGIFVSTNLNAQHIEKGSRKFLEELGYHSTELEILFD